MSRNQAAPNIVVFPERAPAGQPPRKPKAVKAADLPRRAALEDQRDVVKQLEALLNHVHAKGSVSGLMLVARDPEGNFTCASSGWCRRHPAEGLRSGMLGILNLCDKELTP